MLIEEAGGIVTREDIKNRLWPNDTVVDFDHSINATIKTLRRALGDSAGNPRYIETLARRGYRLMVTIEYLNEAPNADPWNGNSVQVVAEPGALIGKKVSHYRVLDVVGGGGMGMVYRAEDLRLGRSVALKFLPEEVANDQAAIKRFLREAQTASALNHPNICTIHEIEEQEGEPFIVMELLQGDTLRGRMEDLKPRPLPLLELLDAAIQVCDGLDAAHSNGIIHRDIKPANIFLTNTGTIKILDFGLAKMTTAEKAEADNPPDALPRPSDASECASQMRPTLTRQGTTAGTAAYMSPEQVRNEELDSRTDLFSFGLLLYEAATGTRAFAGETREEVHQAILIQTPPSVRESNPTIPRELDALIAKALVKDRRERYQSAAEMRRDLAQIKRHLSPARQRVQTALVVTAALVIVGLGLSSYWSYRHRITLAPTDTIVLADIRNQTSDAVFDSSLNTAIRRSLEQTPYLNVLGIDKVFGSLALLKLPPATKLTPEIAREVCNHTNSKMVIGGTVSDVGNRYGLQLDATDCISGRLIAKVEKDSVNRIEVIGVLGSLATQLRSKLGEPSASLNKFNKPLDVALSPSLEALQAATEGYKHHTAGDVGGAVARYQRALELDPNFGLVYEGLGVGQLFLGQEKLAREALTKAYELRDRMTEPDRLHAEDNYFDLVTGEVERACSVLKETVRVFPRDFIAHTNLGSCFLVLGQPALAASEAREAARLQPSPWTFSVVMSYNIFADRLEDAKAASEEAKAHKFDSPFLRYQRMRLAFLTNDKAALHELQSVADPHNSEFKNELMQIEEYQGHRRAAKLLLDQIITKVSKGDARKYDRVGQALYEAKIGNFADARLTAIDSVPDVRDPARRAALALAFALAGDEKRSEDLADALDQEFPLSTAMQNYCLPTIRAVVRLRAGDAAGAIKKLQPILKYDLALCPCFGSLYPAYIRGLAYLQMGEAQLAAAEFQKVLDHPGFVGYNSNGPLARLQLARAQLMLGDENGARKSYEEFLSLWKTADSDLPIYREAKAEFARLTR